MNSSSGDELRLFDPNAPGEKGKLWGLPFTVEGSLLVILPVPWEVTVSYGTGTAGAPGAILAASTQVDLYDSGRPDAFRKGIAMAPVPEDLKRRGDALRPRALLAIEGDETALDEVNRACEEMVTRVRVDSAKLLDAGKRVGVLGGDHSVPLGLMQALAERYQSFGILHVDAHADLRDAYEGFVHSHASIMHNALRLEAVENLVQVGIRDYCEEEIETIRASEGRVRLFDFRGLSRRRFSGESWSSIGESILSELPSQVYVSFDIDGLDPALCPGTGTPVPGGLAFEEALFLVDRVRETGREIIGFDLCEVSSGETSGEWDANVGARVLYRLCCAAMP